MCVCLFMRWLHHLVTPYALQVRYDALLEQSGSDMSIYTRMVCDTVCITVPKAVVHCMVKKSEKNLLERLFTGEQQPNKQSSGNPCSPSRLHACF